MAGKWIDISLGVGVYHYDNLRPDNQKTFLDKDPVIEPIPTANIRVGPLFLNRDGGGLALLFFKHLKLLGLVLYEGKPYRADGMEERKKSFQLGGGLRIYNLEALYYQDVQGRSHGRVLKFTFAPEYKISGYTFSPRPYVQFYCTKYVDYYFGVREDEVDLTKGRYAYHGARAINYGIMLRNSWDVGRMKYVLTAGMKWYGSRVYNSPTVVRKNESRILLGFMYKFY